MKRTTRRKLPALIAVLSAGLLLTSCYIPPDDISDGQNLNIGSTNLPFQTIAAATPTPVPTMAPAVVTQDTGVTNPQPTYDWTAAGTTTEPALAQNTIVVITSTPMPTQAPTAVPTAKPTASPTPTSSTLRVGSTGDSVKTVQQLLKNLGYYKGSVDGSFGKGTEEAVKAFQRANGLSVDGAVGAATLAKLQSSSAAAAATVKPTAKPTRKPTPKPTAKPTSSVLKNGSSGSAVRTVQQRLKDLGYYDGSVDGVFGDGTEEAVKAFQKRNNLTPDGQVGSETLARLKSSSARAKTTPKPTATPTPRPTATMKVENTYIEEGASGKSVKQLQERLIALGWLSGTADGEYGAATEKALIAFQKKTKGLYADGVAGPDTLKALMSSGAARSSTPVASVGETLELGSEGNAVRALQQRLKDLGYYHGSVDGSFGNGTQDAVIAFQERNELVIDGRAGTTTLNTLYSVDAIPNE